ncbi:SigE family RNA polymerase sigma factor [Ornithinimicrobium panacihumi]|uniref:SigE family RNA polymerase sigma factor n=1 Tax=Ornithinimicrobium panacihumi TaxID=2008449 RepID=UPI003F8B7568
MRAAHEAEFVEFVTQTSPRLLTTAWMLTSDPVAAEDLVQEALERVYVRWGRLRSGNPAAYARRILANLHTDGWRKRRREVLSDSPPERDPLDAGAGVGSRPSGSPADSQNVDLVRALQELPTRERECIVLRHYLDLSEQQTAEALGVSLGTVKSSTSRGLAGLRRILEDSHV